MSEENASPTPKDWVSIAYAIGFFIALIRFWERSPGYSIWYDMGRTIGASLIWPIKFLIWMFS